MVFATLITCKNAQAKEISMRIERFRDGINHLLASELAL